MFVVVVVVWFCRSSSLAFLISAYLINFINHFLLHWVVCFGGYLSVHTKVFLKNTWIFCVFLSVPHLVDNYAKIVAERGLNLMCDRTLPSCLVPKKHRKGFRTDSETDQVTDTKQLTVKFECIRIFQTIFLRLLSESEHKKLKKYVNSLCEIKNHYVQKGPSLGYPIQFLTSQSKIWPLENLCKIGLSTSERYAGSSNIFLLVMTELNLFWSIQ